MISTRPLDRIALRLVLALASTFALAGTATAQTCTDPPAGLFAWWPGDGTGHEMLGTRDARLEGGATFLPGLDGDAFAMDGVAGGQDDHVVFSRMSIDGLADFTLELWVRTTDDRGGIISAANGNIGGANELLVMQSVNGLAVWIKQQGSGAIPVFVNDGAWHHLAIVRSGPLGQLYLDGVLVDVRTYPEGALDVGPRGFLLGQDQDCLAGCFDVNQAFDGLVDEPSLYSRALAADEVGALYAAGLGGRCKPPVSSPTNPVVPIGVERVESLEGEVDSLMGRMMDLEMRVDALEAMPQPKAQLRQALKELKQHHKTWKKSEHRRHERKRDRDR